MKIQTIHIRDIDWQDRRFCMSYFSDFSRLKQSIARAGLLTPPQLLETEEGTLIIAHGWRRLQCLKALKKETFQAHVLPPESDHQKLITISFLENASLREFNILEKIYLAHNLLYHFGFSREQIQHQFLPLIGGGNVTQLLAWSEKLLRLPESIQAAFAQEKLSLDWLEDLPGFKPDEANALVNLILELRLGKNRQKELRRLLGDVLRIYRQSLREFLANLDPEVHQPQLTAAQRTERFFRMLRRLRFPEFSKTEEAFGRERHALRLPRGVTLRHSPYFEERTLTMQLQFRSEEELGEQINWLQSVVEQKKLAKIFSLVGERAEEQG